MFQAITEADFTATISGETNLAVGVDITVTDADNNEVYSVSDVAVADDEFSYRTTAPLTQVFIQQL